VPALSAVEGPALSGTIEKYIGDAIASLLIDASLMADVGNDTVAAIRLGGIEGAVGKPQQVSGIAAQRASRRYALTVR
jgi:hypothetical protein